MSTGGSVDERIRAVLDLGDSSGAVKALNQEVEKLLADFKKQTDLFEQKKIAPKDYAESILKLKSEIGGLKTAMDELRGKAPETSASLETLSRTMFALERGTSALLGGTGLARAANLLESVISFAKGPAGIGIALGLVANTIDNVAPKIKAAWDKLWNQFSDEEIAQKRSELAEKAKSLRDAVSQLATQPVPGLEFQEAERQTKLKGLFNAETLLGGEGRQNIQQKLFEAIKAHPGATPTDLQPEEKEAIKRQQDIIDSGQRSQREAYQTGGAIGYGMEALTHPGRMLDPVRALWDPGWRTRAQNEIQRIQSQAAERTANQLIVQAQQPGRAGQTARAQLLGLAKRYPGVLPSESITKLEQLVKAESHPDSEDETARQSREQALEYHGPPPAPYPPVPGGRLGVHFQEGPVPGALDEAARRTRTGHPFAAGPPFPEGMGRNYRPRYRGAEPFAREMPQVRTYAQHHSQQLNKVLDLSRMHATSTEKTQKVLADIQNKVESFEQYVKRTTRNADNLLQRQQRAQQNTTGSP